MKTILKRGVFAILALGAAAAIYVALRPGPMRVETATVVCGPMAATIDGEGKTRLHDRFIVAAPVAGRLSRIELHRGDPVASGAVLARIESVPLQPLDPRQTAEARARVAAAEHLTSEAAAVVERARADCEQARRERERAERLVETGDVSRQEFERLRNAEQTCRRQLEAAAARARAAASEADVARAALLALEQAGRSSDAALVTVRAPIRGRVLRVLEESERVVPAGTPLLELSREAGERALEIVVDLLSTDAVRVRPGMPMQVDGWGGERPLDAIVRLIEPSAFTKISALGVEEQRVNVVADFTSPTESLGDGYRLEARITVWERPDALKVPAGALFRRGAAWCVFVVENGFARTREIDLGHRNAAEAEVLRNLKEGERVILHPSNQLAEGARVIAEEKS